MSNILAKVVQKLRSEGIKKGDLSRKEFLKHAWEWTLNELFNDMANNIEKAMAFLLSPKPRKNI